MAGAESWIVFAFLTFLCEGFAGGDPNSYARPDLVKTNHLHLELEVDFDARQLVGSVVIMLERLSPTARTVALDIRDLHIDTVSDLQSGEDLDWHRESGNEFGEKLEIMLPTSELKEYNISISYNTSPNSSALQWLNKNQTSGKRDPFLFSQNYPIHARSVLKGIIISNIK